MCWGEAASVGRMAAGSAATAFTWWRSQPPAVWVTFAYFTVMEALQALGYRVVDDCASPTNQTLTLLSYLHIVFQPFFINAFALELVPPIVRRRARAAVYLACAVSAAVMLVQLYPFEWAGPCRAGRTLCGEGLCLVRGEWHIAWDVPYNGLLASLEDWLGPGWAFPTYVLTVFALPLAYGAWRFVLFHALAGPILAAQLTSNPNEAPAIWCLFSIGLLAIGLSPWLRARFSVRGGWAWPAKWRARPTPG